MPAATEGARAGPRWSLRRRVLLLTTSVTAAAWLVGAGAIFLVQQRVSDRLFDQRLHDIAGAVLTFADHEINELREAGADIVHLEGAATLGARYKYQIWSNDGELLLISVDTGRTPFAPRNEDGFSTREVDGQSMRVLVMTTDDQRKVLEVAEPMAARSAGFDPGLLILGVPLLLSLGVLLGVGAWVGRRTTQSLSDAARQVTQRSPAGLRPLTVANPPAELTPILAAINSLFERIDNAMAAERRFTAAAAHELRTPLAAIKIQAQVAQLTPDPQEQRQLIERILASIDTAARNVEQLLIMSRIDGMIALKAQAACLRLDVLAGHVIEEIRPIAARRSQVLVEALGGAKIEGLEFGVAVLIRNLIENAIHYSPVGGTIRVSTGRQGELGVLTVEDTGPGIAPEQHQRVFQRFYRLPGDAGTDGFGIGLSIVRAVVELHRAHIELGRSDLGGLRVLVRFPSSGIAADAGSDRAQASPVLATPGSGRADLS